VIKPISNGMRWLLLVAGFLVPLAGFRLFILTEYTDQYFAWMIQPFITAAFLGGGYFASFLMEMFERGFWAMCLVIGAILGIGLSQSLG
jgi:hypothetical protein